MSGGTLTRRDTALQQQRQDAVWDQRLRRDVDAAALRQTDELRAITDELLARTLAIGGLSFALTGSTALDHRTRLSDLDLYVVGNRPTLPESDEEIDLYAVGPEEFRRRLDGGDDYLHWTLRFGLILHDVGPFRWAWTRITGEQLWPDPSAKAIQARRALEMANAIVATGDRDAAVEQCRVAFSLVARWWLLKSGEFPKARGDLPNQLSRTPIAWLGDVLGRTIHDDPRPEELAAALGRTWHVLDG